MLDNQRILVVDLDNSLIKSDYLCECFVNYFSNNILAPFISCLVYFRAGKIGLKKFLYKKSNISVENLPYDKKVLEFIKEWKNQNQGGEVYLVSASYHEAIGEIARHLNCFEGFYGTQEINLKSQNKLDQIKKISNNKKFTYLGDSYEDLAIWEDAEQCVLVNPSQRLKNKTLKLNSSIQTIESKFTNPSREIIKTLRVHQWVKNCLLFVPAVLTLEPLFGMSGNLISGFIAFSFVASAFYIINDLFDIENDRNHDSKKHRSFASGSLSILQGTFVFCLLIFGATLISFNLLQSFQLCLGLYAISTFLYSKYLKKIPILDIFTLTYLYLLRVITGGALVEINISNWLLTYSVFFFLFLAAVKRWIELKKLKTDFIPGRGYQVSDLPFISQLSYFSGLISVLIICLYIESQQAQTLYDSSKILWFIPVILLYWILETLYKVEKGKVDDDPVKYALKSRTSYFTLIGFAFILFLTTTG